MLKKMYLKNPVVKLPENLLLPHVMHKVYCHFTMPGDVKETYYETTKPHLSNKKLLSSENMEELVVRQENILEKLKEIKVKLTRLQQGQNISRSTSLPKKFNADFQSLKSDVVQDIVIFSNSNHPPYFIKALQKLLHPHVKILYASSTHSSAPEVHTSISRLFQDNNFQERSNFDVIFTIIWKNQKFKTLMVNTLTQSPVIGEGNILRYLARFFPALSPLNYERKDLSDVTETDYWLDFIQSKFLHGNIKERQNVLKQLNSKLGSYEWINGKHFGICDIFLWSALKQLGTQMSSDLPANVERWMKKLVI